MPLAVPPAALVLDRDGVLNELWYEAEFGTVDSPHQPRQVTLCRGAAQAVRMANAAGVPVHVVSNQPGVAKGKCSPRLLLAVTRRLVELLADEGARLDGVHYCLHHESASVERLRGDCPNRKPRPGLLEELCRTERLEPQDCWFVGDTPRDIEAGRAAGFRTAWVGTVRCDVCPTRRAARPDISATDLTSVISQLLGSRTS
ncbi:D-glycero-alpha-D-manno-heptose-1,7-bisphosphate 7-phosphatase [Streptomyces sp. NPDC091287]|uniref:D-glycero-alpha-D-manno-heptose-1,7-bisphosphate 7-phosphatase n=1 Tax=Streptomyces sp. NPDC091287 TaxID=3365988 RepID=UPI0038287B28